MSVPAPKIGLSTALICSFPAVGGILFGYDSGWISGVLAMKQFKRDFGKPGSRGETAYKGYLLSSTDKSLITSILSAGTFCGALSAGYCSDRFGRKSTIMLGTCIYTIGVIIEEITHGSVPLLVVGRAIAGFGVGLISATTIMYASEIAPKQIRGPVLGAYQLLITFGLFLAACVSFGTKDYLSTASYRIPIGVQFGLALILFLGSCFMPESPRWYIMKGREMDAKKSLAFIWRQDVDSEFIKQECEALASSYQVEVEAGANDASFLDCFRGGFKRGSNLHRTLIGTSIQMFQQLTGVNFIFYYGTTFFQRSSITDPFVISMVVNAVNVASTPVALWAIERLGRRKLLITGAIGMAICEYIVAIVGTVNSDSRSSSNALIAFVSFFIFFFASSWGPCAWAVCGEMYPQSTRSQSTALSTASNWLWNFIIAFVTPYLVDDQYAGLGAKVFFIFGGCASVCALYAFGFVYETKGMSLEDVDAMMRECSARESPHWHGRDTFVRRRASERGSLKKWFSWRKSAEDKPTAMEMERPSLSDSSRQVQPRLDLDV